MKAALRLEIVGMKIDQDAAALSKMVRVASAGAIDFGKPYNRRPWVAMIVGKSSEFRFDRKFLDGTRDYSTASGTGNRGVYVRFVLCSSEVYEVFHFVSWKSSDRYFCGVNADGEIERITAEDVERHLESAARSERPAGSEGANLESV